MNRNTGTNAGQVNGTMNGQQVVGLDIAKLVFQTHTVNMATGEVIDVQIKRAKVLEHLARRVKHAPGGYRCLVTKTAPPRLRQQADPRRAADHPARARWFAVRRSAPAGPARPVSRAAAAPAHCAQESRG